MSSLSVPAPRAIGEGSMEAVEMDDVGDLIGWSCVAYEEE